MARERGLSKQVQDVLDGKLKIGQSRYADKPFGVTSDHIYSWSTYRAYLKHGCYFVKWAKDAHKSKTLEEARAHVDEYLLKRMEADKVSPYTQKLEAAALAKLYGCTTNDFVKTEVRHRDSITRSRGAKKRDRHFSENRNQEFVDFCKSTGLRRSEIKTLRGNQLEYDEKTGMYTLNIVGKGGRRRTSPVLSMAAVERIRCSEAGLVWDKIPNGADIHSYRADYCTAIYNRYARQRKEIPLTDRYCCRGDLRGVWYDKRAMEVATRALGHNRISVIAGHYIRKEDESDSNGSS